MSKPVDEIPNPRIEISNPSIKIPNSSNEIPNPSNEISKYVIPIEPPTTEDDLILPSNSRNV